MKINNIKNEAEELLVNGKSLAEVRKTLYTRYKDTFISARDYDNKIGRHCRKYLGLHPELKKTAYFNAEKSNVDNATQKTYKSMDVETTEDGKVNGVVKAPQGTYQSEKDILEAMELDPELFTIVSCKKSRWEAQARGGEVIQMEAFKVSCVKKEKELTQKEVIESTQRAIEKAKKRINYEPIEVFSNEEIHNRMGVFQVCDCHFGAYCSKEEHGIQWGPKECQEDLNFITDQAIRHLKNEPVDSLIIAMTGDGINSDTIDHTTSHGTQQIDVLMHYSKLVQEYFQMMCEIIDKFEQSLKIKINVLHTIGNHDKKTMFDLIFMLKVRYANDPNVIILDELNTRKYRVYGNSLLVFSHGQSEGKRITKVPQNEAPKAVGMTTTTYLITEHTHQYRIEPDGRTIWITGSTIAPPGTWTKDSAYVGGKRGGQLLIFDKKYCLTSQHFLPVYHDKIDDFVVDCENFI